MQPIEHAGYDGSFFDALSPDGHSDVVTIDPDACAACTSTLSALCASDASMEGPCPPALDSPAFDAWAQQELSKPGVYRLGCGQITACPEMVIVGATHVDTATVYYFDAVTKKLIAIVGEGIAHVGCIASDVCLPFRCMDDGGASFVASSSCPPMPDGGLVDASTD